MTMRFRPLLAAGVALACLTSVAPAGQGIYRSTGTLGNNRSVDLAFQDRTDVLLGGKVVSLPATFHGSSTLVPIVATKGEIRLCADEACRSAGPWSDSLEIRDGSVLQARVDGPDQAFGTSVAVMTVMGATVSFEVSGRGEPTIGRFSDANVDPGVMAESSLATFAGWASAPITVTGGEYRVCSSKGACGDFGAVHGLVSDGDQIQLRTLSGGFGHTRSVSVEAAGVSRSWTVVTRQRDLVPDAVSFAPASEAEPGDLVASAPVVLTGHDGISVDVEGGEYRICPSTSCQSGVWAAQPASDVPSGAIVQVRGIAAGPDSGTTVTLLAGSSSFPFSIASRTLDTVPDQIILGGTQSDAVEPGAVVQTSYSELTGLDSGSAAVSGVGATLSVNEGPFTIGPVSVRRGDTVALRLVAGAFGERRTATLDVGGSTASFSVIARVKDTTPDPFAFPPVAAAEPGTGVSSAAATLAGFDDGPISVSGGEYALNSGAFTSVSGTARPGDTVRLRVVSGTFGESRTATATVGGVASAFVATTRAKDTAPDAFPFAVVTDRNPSTSVSSAGVALSGLDDAPISVAGGEYSLNGGAFTTAGGTVRKGDVVVLRLTTGSFGESRTATATVGGVVSSFVATTRAKDTVPAAFALGTGPTGVEPATASISQSATLSGFDDAPISIAGTGAAYSIDGGSFTTSAGTARAGDTVRVQLVAGSIGETRTGTLTIGGVSATWSSTVRAKDTTPDSFALGTGPTNVEPASVSTSQSATLVGFDDATISVAGGTYSLNGGSFVATTGTARPNDVVRVQTTAGAFGESRQVTLSVGSTSAIWAVSTRARDVSPTPFSFAASTGAQPGATVVSPVVRLLAHEGVSVSVSGSTGAQYQVCTTSTCGDQGSNWISTATDLVPVGAYARVRVTASSTMTGVATATLQAGTESAAFQVSTRDYASCPVPWASATADTIPHGQTVTAYSAEKVTNVSQCSTGSQGRTCNDGVLSGSSTYRYRTCGVSKTISVTCQSKAGSVRTLTAEDYGQDALSVVNPGNTGVWVVYRNGPYLNCHDNRGAQDFETHPGCVGYSRQPQVFAGGAYLVYCNWN